MRILYVNYEYPPLGGGGGIAMKEVAEQLARRHEVHVLTSGLADSPREEHHPSVDLTIHRTRVLGRNARATASFLSMGAFLPSGWTSGNRLISRKPFDVINSWFAIPSGIVGGAIAKHNHVPHVLTVIGGDIFDPSKWYSPHWFPPSRAAVRSSLAKADALVAISTDIARRAQEHFAVRDPIKVIPLGIAEPKFRPATRTAVGLAADRKYIVAVGRLVRRKDYPSLLRAIASIGREDVSLLILGDGPEADNLRSLSSQLGIADRVELRGFVPEEEKFQILANADLFALASLHEGFGVVYLEAMYCGLPIIAASKGGQVDFLDDSATGRLVPAGDVDALSRAISELLGDPHAARAIGAANRQRFREFLITEVSAQYEALYERITNQIS
jgi:glycosyltransferase involved in cell wall biosynthesis